MIGLYQGILSTLIRFCMDKHWPVEATFRYAGYDLTELRIGQVPLSPDQFFGLLDCMAQQHHCPTVVLELGHWMHSEQLGIFGGLIATSTHLTQAVQRFSQFKPLLNVALDLRLECDAQGVWLRYQSNDQRPIGQHRYYPELLFSTLLAQGQQFLGQPIVPLAVQFRHAAPDYAARYTDFFACPITFAADHDALLLPTQVMNQPFVTASQRFHHHLLATAQTLCPDQTVAVRDEVAQYLMIHLHDASACQLQAIAQYMGRSRRTLQRQLQHEHTSVQQLLDEIRKQQALKLVSQTLLPFEQISQMLGFAYPSSFNACFLTWTGHTPTRYRAAQRA